MTESIEMPEGKAIDKRLEERMSATRPVQLDRGTGVTRNVSTSGVFFETNEDYAEGSEITFAIELDGPQGEKLMLRSRGQIVRVERLDGRVGVAAKVVTSQLESGAEPRADG
jgi:hypothetical protein